MAKLCRCFTLNNKKHVFKSIDVLMKIIIFKIESSSKLSFALIKYARNLNTNSRKMEN